MNKKIIFSALLIAALMVSSMQMAVFAVAPNVTPLGLQIAGKADEVTSDLQTDIKNYIIEHKTLMAETQLERLNIIEEHKATLNTMKEETKAERQEAIAAFEAGDIDEEEFEAQMKAIATDLANQKKSMEKLGQMLGDLGKNLAAQLKARAQGLSEEIIETESEIEEEGSTIAEEMTGQNLPVPDNLPGKPDQIPPSHSSGQKPEQIPSET
jgi:chromosome segregation ATPase